MVTHLAAHCYFCRSSCFRACLYVCIVPVTLTKYLKAAAVLRKEKVFVYPLSSGPFRKVGSLAFTSRKTCWLAMAGEEDHSNVSKRECNSEADQTDYSANEEERMGDKRNSPPIQSVEEFRDLMYKVQAARRLIVSALLNDKKVLNEWKSILNDAFKTLTDSRTKAFQREMQTTRSKLLINIKDETTGLVKDLRFLELLDQVFLEHPGLSSAILLSYVDLGSILAPYHPISPVKFQEEQCQTANFLRVFVTSNSTDKKPIFITDWDGTMKNYCSQYATNLQPVYSAIGMTRFAERFTRISAVLTAGPLRGPGILDLTAMPTDGPVLFSGSWGREWWLHDERIVHNDGISEEGFVALEKMNDEMNSLLHTGDYSMFAMVGSGMQRKVDRLTLGVQTVCGHVPPELSKRYQDEVKERMHRIDPQNHVLVFDPSTTLEVEVVAHNSGIVWNKADGVDRVIAAMGDSLETPGRVLICGDTRSDLPMVRQAAAKNPEGVMVIFVGLNDELRQEVRRIVGDDRRCCFVSCPDAIHAAMASVLDDDVRGVLKMSS